MIVPLILAAAELAFGVGHACLPVSGDPIRARDLAPIFPLMAGRAETLAPAPLPGARRMMSAAELERSALRLGATFGQSRAVCFEWPLEMLTEERIRQAIEKSLPPAATLELIDYSRYAAPPGEILFPASGLEGHPAAPSRTPSLWRGRLQYAEKRSLPIWARVRVAIERRLVVARSTLATGREIRAEDVSVEERSVSPFRAGFLEEAGNAVGKFPKRVIRAGEFLSASMLADPPAVLKGESVRLEVSSGAAKVSMEAMAETSAQAGAIVHLRNQTSGRRFTATAEQKGEARIRVDAISSDGRPDRSRLRRDGGKEDPTQRGIATGPLHQ